MLKSLKKFWDRVFKTREDCAWFIEGFCYKHYPTGYPDMKEEWKICKEICGEFEDRGK